MDEEAVGQVEEAGLESGIETVDDSASEPSETTVDDTMVDLDALDTNLENVNLDVLKARYGEKAPEIVQLGKQFQADYTRKTQALAAERRALDAIKQEMEKQWNQTNLQKGADIDINTATPEQLYQHLLGELSNRFQTMLDSRVNPLAQEVSVAKMQKMVNEMQQADPVFKEPEVISKVTELASEMGNQGVRAQVVMQAAAYQKVKGQLEALQRSLNKKKAAAVKQSAPGSTDVATKAAPAGSFSDTFESIRQKVIRGEL